MSQQALRIQTIPEESLPTLRILWAEGVALLKAADVESSLPDARLLLQHALSLSPEAFLLALENVVEDEYTARYFRYLDRRIDHEPVSRIMGRRAFWKHEFLITTATLDPRPDSETLLEAVLDAVPGRHAPLKLLDLGTGTGCLLLSLLAEYEQASGVGIDQSLPAVEIATLNARRLELQERAEFMVSDWQDFAGEKFDIIISNPPYIPTAAIQNLMPEVAGYDPRAALDGGADGLDAYRAIFARLHIWLAAGGVAAFEVGIGQDAEVRALAEEAGFTWKETRADLAGVPRIVVITSTSQAV